ncbi:MAG: HDOD domain-containing protein [Gallionella sp.]|jgi:putative nucleotidyltransferase with HDIG domain
MTHAVKLKLAISQLDTLPGMPAIAQKLLSLALDTDDGEAQLLKLIEQDPLISAKVIGLANSPMFGSSRKVNSVSDATMLLGLTRVKSVAIGIATMSAVTRIPEGLLKANDLWQHSMAVAMVMRTLAKALPARNRPLDDHIFLAGLVHDIGFMALSYLNTEASDALHTALQAQPERTITDIELELIGITHSEIGARLARHWDLPEEIIAIIRYHHTPDEKDAEAGQPLVKLLHIAERLLGDLGISEHTAQPVSDEEWLTLDISPEKAQEIIAQIPSIAEQAGQLAGAV